MATFQVLSLRLFLLSTLALGTLSSAQNASQHEHPIKLLSPDESFHFEMLVSLGESIYSGGDIGPILGAAKDIKPSEFESFASIFFKLANRTKTQAEDPSLAYDPVNVRDTWFAVSTYFRRADFYTHGNWDDPRINAYWEEQTNAFDKAIAALPVLGKRLTIPADRFDVEAIWYAVFADRDTKRPTIILGNGYDGAQEDLYHIVVVPALARGWNTITYDGPGQPGPRRHQNIGFIPDWERVVTPVVDYLLTEYSDSVDDDRLVLFGLSFGGYLAARAAAFEPRLSAVLLNGGVWNTYDAFAAQLRPEGKALLELGNKTAFDAVVAQSLNSSIPTQTRWAIKQGLWAFNTKSSYDWLTSTKYYTVEHIISNIKVPVWIADAEFEGFFTDQAPLVKQALGDQATYHRFNGTAGYHCQVGAFQEMNREMFAWLNRTLS